MAAKTIVSISKLWVIAHEVGYTEISSFSRIFKKFEGISPQQYRNNLLTLYHDLYCDENEYTGFMMTNKKSNPDIGVIVKYKKSVLDNLTQWKYLCKKDYVMALEPCNNLVKGVDYESNKGNLKFIEPGESISIKLEIKFLSTINEIESAKSYLTSPSLQR